MLESEGDRKKCNIIPTRDLFETIGADSTFYYNIIISLLLPTTNELKQLKQNNFINVYIKLLYTYLL
jgi:hypothetical protein